MKPQLKYNGLAPLIVAAHERVRDMYGSAIGASKYDVVTPALVVDRDILRSNLEYMQSRLPGLHARLRGHVKNHKSPHIARMQLGRRSSWFGRAPTTS